ncbi:hypothetical protein N0V95_005422 [Ascochyta clinopodiicola]|nr:hypothetical protein N0V95_005422 [Ascochyta clinopodiicola]
MASKYAWEDSCDALEAQSLSIESLDVPAIVTSRREPLSAFSNPLLTEQAIDYAETPCGSNTTNDAAHEGDIEMLLHQALTSNSKHAFLPTTNHLTAASGRSMRDININDDVRELQEATAMFLADQYDTGEFVAMPDDIIDLEKATSAFLADRCDGEWFCMEGPGPGLLLPDRHFLVSASKAVEITRAVCDPTKDKADLIHAHLDSQPSCENETNTLLLDTCSEVDVSQDNGASLHDHVNLDSWRDITQRDEDFNTSLISESSYATWGELSKLPSDLDLCDDGNSDEEDDDEFSDTTTDLSDVAFDAPDALSLSQASYAASFFDSKTETLVAYTSLDLLLTMDYERELMAFVHRAVDDEDELDADDDCGVAEIGEVISDGQNVHLDDVWFDWNVPVDPSTTQFGQHCLQEVVALLPTIFEEDEPNSASSRLGTPLPQHNDLAEDDDEIHAPLSSRLTPTIVAIPDFTQHRRHLDVEANAQIDGVQDDGLPHPPSLRSTKLHEKNFACSELFADDIWTKGPNLGLTFSVDPTVRRQFVDDAGVDLQGVLTAVFEVIQTRSWYDVPSFGTDLKQNLCTVTHGSGNVNWTEQMNKTIDLVMSHMAARGRFDSVMF